jgi:hypothetical protein
MAATTGTRGQMDSGEMGTAAEAPVDAAPPRARSRRTDIGLVAGALVVGLLVGVGIGGGGSDGGEVEMQAAADAAERAERAEVALADRDELIADLEAELEEITSEEAELAREERRAAQAERERDAAEAEEEAAAAAEAEEAERAEREAAEQAATAEREAAEQAAEEERIAAEQAAEEEAAANSVGNGIHEVGRDIRAGTYRSSGPTPDALFCYYARLRNASGDFDAIIANNNSEGPVTVTLNDGEFFESAFCRTWERQ